ncbi:MAG: hypothetical protein IIC74_00420 [Bacteroidetes bacterium]|nr:hypothetical protein [Bacteroidota bacterium]
MKTKYDNSISQSHNRVREESFGRVKRTYRKPTFSVGYYESQVLTK